METRSRKRAEATSKRPPPAQRSKRARTSSDLPTGSGSRSRFSVRIGSAVGASTTATASKHQFGMDSAHELAGTSTGSGSRASRRDKDKASKREHEKDDDRGSEKVLRGAGGAEKETDKGKEKEQEKDVGRDRDKVAAALGDVDEENEGEAVGTISQNLASASSALHGLLRKLGAGLDELLPSTTASAHQSTRLKRILSGLRAEGEEGRQLESLSQLCELLSIGTEESLSSFSVDSFVPVLVNLLSHDYNPDVMLLAARALTHLCDVLPSSCAAVVHYGAVPHFCARLLTIEYIDLAEQSLQALEKISHEHPSACLRSGALMAVLSYLDFFSTGVQRVAVSTAANICRQLPSDSTDIVMMAVPILTTLLQNQDSKVVEHASVCLTRIADSFANSAEKIDQLCSYDLIQLTVSLISVSSANGSTVSQTSLSTSTYTGLIRLLSTCASGSAGATEGLLQSNISKTLKDVLVGASFVSSTCTAPTSVARPPEQLYEIMSLVNELLPPIREVNSSTSASEGRSSGRKGHGSSSNRLEVPSNSDISPREKFLLDHPELLLQFGADLFSVLVQVYGSSVSSSVRHKCLAAINKLMHFSTAEMLSTLSKESNISSFLASVLASKDQSVLMMSLSIADLLMQKLPALFSKLFVKEGVVHALDLLISSDQTGSQQASPSGRNTDGSSSSVKPRRVPSRRRPTGSNVDAMPEDPGGSNVGVVGSPPTGSEQVVQPSRGGLQAAVILKAKQLKDTHFSADVGLVTGVSDSLCKLKDLCAKLNADGLAEVKGKGKGKARTIPSSPSCDEHMISVISDILTELGIGDGVSTFEFVGSGVVDSLLKFLSCGGMSKDNASENATFRLRHQVLRRFKRFLELSLPLDHDDQKELPLTVLVRKIQNALGSLERFPVILSHGPRASGGAASIAAGLSALTQPFKLRLCRAPADKLLRDYSSNIVLIEPLATLAAVEEFLWPRVRKHDGSPTSAAAASSSDGVGSPTTVAPSTSTSTSAPAANEHRPSTRSRTVLAAASAKEPESGASKGKAKVSSSSKTSPVVDHQGPETRNAAARRKAEAAVSAASKQTPLDDHVDSDDDELDVSPVEIEEAVAMDEDDLSDDGDDDDDDHEEVFGEEAADVCIGDRVHDVQLGDGTDVAGTVSTSATTSESPSQPSSIFGTGLAGAARAALLKPGIEASGSRAAGIGTRGSLSFAAALGGSASPSANGARSSRDRRSLVAMSASNAPPRLAFFLGGKQLNRSLTIFQAIQRQTVTDEDDEEKYAGPDHPSGNGRRLWDEVYTITYQRVDAATDKSPVGTLSSNGFAGKGMAINQNKAVNVGSSSSMVEGSWQQASLVETVLQGELPCDLDKSNPTYNILLLLRVLESLNHLAPQLRSQIASDAFAEGRITSLDELKVDKSTVPQEEFLSSKLTPKLARQMQDALALCSGGLPAWCHQLTRACPFLFPFETRRQYFHSTAFGLSRALHRLQQQQSVGRPLASTERELRVGRLQRQKVRVSRTRILESAAKVMELYSGHRAVLEVEYFGEVGTGLGPTLEFYTLLSHELQKRLLDLWRDDAQGRSDSGIHDVEMQDIEGESGGKHTDQKDEYVNAPLGLFPRPWASNLEGPSKAKFEKVTEHFRLLGRVMAKALQDGRLLDLPLSMAFYKLVLGQELDLHDIKSIDLELGNALHEMKVLVQRKQFLESALEISPEGNLSLLSSLTFRGSKIEDLCLDFTLPGYPNYVLKDGGNNIMVALDNLEEYVSLVVDATLRSGIAPQMEAFRAGFNQVFLLSSLQIFNEDELDYLLCGRRELWTADSLAEHIKFDHGYNSASFPIKNLLEIMGELTPDEQRAFLRFVTGAPRLPPGGLAALNPKLTIVRKHPTGTNGASATLSSTPPGAISAMGTTLADRDLPSVMTCANYLKLPPYSCKEVMRERLLYAISEGQGSFDLS